MNIIESNYKKYFGWLSRTEKSAEQKTEKSKLDPVVQKFRAKTALSSIVANLRQTVPADSRFRPMLTIFIKAKDYLDAAGGDIAKVFKDLAFQKTLNSAELAFVKSFLRSETGRSDEQRIFAALVNIVVRAFQSGRDPQKFKIQMAKELEGITGIFFGITDKSGKSTVQNIAAYLKWEVEGLDRNLIRVETKRDYKKVLGVLLYNAKGEQVDVNNISGQEPLYIVDPSAKGRVRFKDDLYGRQGIRGKGLEPDLLRDPLQVGVVTTEQMVYWLKLAKQKGDKKLAQALLRGLFTMSGPQGSYGLPAWRGTFAQDRESGEIKFKVDKKESAGDADLLLIDNLIDLVHNKDHEDFALTDADKKYLPDKVLAKTEKQNALKTVLNFYLDRYYNQQVIKENGSSYFLALSEDVVGREGSGEFHIEPAYLITHSLRKLAAYDVDRRDVWLKVRHDAVDRLQEIYAQCGDMLPDRVIAQYKHGKWIYRPDYNDTREHLEDVGQKREVVHESLSSLRVYWDLAKDVLSYDDEQDPAVKDDFKTTKQTKKFLARVLKDRQIDETYNINQLTRVYQYMQSNKLREGQALPDLSDLFDSAQKFFAGKEPAEIKKVLADKIDAEEPLITKQFLNSIWLQVYAALDKKDLMAEAFQNLADPIQYSQKPDQADVVAYYPSTIQLLTLEGLQEMVGRAGEKIKGVFWDHERINLGEKQLKSRSYNFQKALAGDLLALYQDFNTDGKADTNKKINVDLLNNVFNTAIEYANKLNSEGYTDEAVNVLKAVDKADLKELKSFSGLSFSRLKTFNQVKGDLGLAVSTQERARSILDLHYQVERRSEILGFKLPMRFEIFGSWLVDFTENSRMEKTIHDYSGNASHLYDRYRLIIAYSKLGAWGFVKTESVNFLKQAKYPADENSLITMNKMSNVIGILEGSLTNMGEYFDSADIFKRLLKTPGQEKNLLLRLAYGRSLLKLGERGDQDFLKVFQEELKIGRQIFGVNPADAEKLAQASKAAREKHYAGLIAFNDEYFPAGQEPLLWGTQLAHVFGEFNMPKLSQLLGDIMYGRIKTDSELKLRLESASVRTDLDILEQKLRFRYTEKYQQGLQKQLIQQLYQVRHFVEKQGIDEKMLQLSLNTIKAKSASTEIGLRLNEDIQEFYLEDMFRSQRDLSLMYFERGDDTAPEKAKLQKMYDRWQQDAKAWQGQEVRLLSKTENEKFQTLRAELEAEGLLKDNKKLMSDPRGVEYLGLLGRQQKYFALKAFVVKEKLVADPTALLTDPRGVELLDIYRRTEQASQELWQSMEKEIKVMKHELPGANHEWDLKKQKQFSDSLTLFTKLKGQKAEVLFRLANLATVNYQDDKKNYRILKAKAENEYNFVRETYNSVMNRWYSSWDYQFRAKKSVVGVFFSSVGEFVKKLPVLGEAATAFKENFKRQYISGSSSDAGRFEILEADIFTKHNNQEYRIVKKNGIYEVQARSDQEEKYKILESDLASEKDLSGYLQKLGFKTAKTTEVIDELRTAQMTVQQKRKIQDIGDYVDKMSLDWYRQNDSKVSFEKKTGLIVDMRRAFLEAEAKLLPNLSMAEAQFRRGKLLTLATSLTPQEFCGESNILILTGAWADVTIDNLLLKGDENSYHKALLLAGLTAGYSRPEIKLTNGEGKAELAGTFVWRYNQKKAWKTEVRFDSPEEKAFYFKLAQTDFTQKEIEDGRNSVSNILSRFPLAKIAASNRLLRVLQELACKEYNFARPNYLMFMDSLFKTTADQLDGMHPFNEDVQATKSLFEILRLDPNPVKAKQTMDQLLEIRKDENLNYGSGYYWLVINSLQADMAYYDYRMKTDAADFKVSGAKAKVIRDMFEKHNKLAVKMQNQKADDLGLLYTYTTIKLFFTRAMYEDSSGNKAGGTDFALKAYRYMEVFQGSPVGAEDEEKYPLSKWIARIRPQIDALTASQKLRYLSIRSEIASMKNELRKSYTFNLKLDEPVAPVAEAVLKLVDSPGLKNICKEIFPKLSDLNNKSGYELSIDQIKNDYYYRNEIINSTISFMEDGRLAGLNQKDISLINTLILANIAAIKVFPAADQRQHYAQQLNLWLRFMFRVRQGDDYDQFYQVWNKERRVPELNNLAVLVGSEQKALIKNNPELAKMFTLEDIATTQNKFKAVVKEPKLWQTEESIVLGAKYREILKRWYGEIMAEAEKKGSKGPAYEKEQLALWHDYKKAVLLLKKAKEFRRFTPGDPLTEAEKVFCRQATENPQVPAYARLD